MWGGNNFLPRGSPQNGFFLYRLMCLPFYDFMVSSKQDRVLEKSTSTTSTEIISTAYIHNKVSLQPPDEDICLKSPHMNYPNWNTKHQELWREWLLDLLGSTQQVVGISSHTASTSRRRRRKIWSQGRPGPWVFDQVCCCKSNMNYTCTSN